MHEALFLRAYALALELIAEDPRRNQLGRGLASRRCAARALRLSGEKAAGSLPGRAFGCSHAFRRRQTSMNSTSSWENSM